MPALRRLPLPLSAALAALIFTAALTTFAQQQRQPQTQLVEAVNVVGNRRLTREELFRHIKTRPGDVYDHGQVMRDLQALGDLGLFNRRSLRVFTETGARGGVEVSFEVQELPVIESVKFEGLKRADEDALLEGLRRRRLEVDGGGVYEPDRIRSMKDAMKELLRGLGWRRVEILIRVEQITATTVNLTFVVSGLPPRPRPAPKRPGRPARKPDAIA